MIIFTLFLFILMVMLGGLAVDLMRYETQRVQLQNTVDRAALAATNLRNSLKPTDVVNSYMTAGGFPTALKSVTVSERSDKRSVTVSAATTVPAFFGNMTGIKRFDLQTVAEATESLSAIEVSLVLDISGSMRYVISNSPTGQTRAEALRTAASDFIDQVLKSQSKNAISINLVPFAGQVNVGPDLFGLLGVTKRHANSHCIDFASTGFSSMALPRSTFSWGQVQTSHFMYFQIDWPTMDWGWCPSDRTATVVASSNAAALKNRISTMRLSDGTGTQYGMKTALALLNPDERPIFAQLASKGVIERDFAKRPLDFRQIGTQKYIILMTDGEITDQFRPWA